MNGHKAFKDSIKKVKPQDRKGKRKPCSWRGFDLLQNDVRFVGHPAGVAVAGHDVFRWTWPITIPNDTLRNRGNGTRLLDDHPIFTALKYAMQSRRLTLDLRRWHVRSFVVDFFPYAINHKGIVNFLRKKSP